MRTQSTQVWLVAGIALLLAAGMGAEQLRGASVPHLFSRQATQTAPAGKPAFQGIYKGTLGTQAIVLEVGASAVHTDDDRNIEENQQYLLEGRYFYRRHGIAILLEGAPLPDGGLRFKEYVGQKASGAEWKLRFNGNDASGFFCKCDVSQTPPAGATLEIKLSRVSEGFDPEFTRPDNGKEPPDQAYYDLLLDFPVKNGPEVHVSEQIAYVMQSDPRFKFNMPRLTRFPDKAVMDKVNASLAARLDNGRLDSAAASQGAGFRGGESDVSARIHWLNRDIFSLTLGGSVFSPGSVHPEGVFEALIYDMRTGDFFDFNTFFVAPEKIVAGKDKQEHDPGGEVSNLDWMLARLYVRYSRNKDEQCGNDFVLDHASAFTRYFAKDGLALQSDLMRECGDAVIVPYSALQSMVRNDSRLHYLVEGRAVSK